MSKKNGFLHDPWQLLRKRAAFALGSFLLIICALLAYASIANRQSAHAEAGSAFSQSATSSGSNQALFWFQPSGWTAGYVILPNANPPSSVTISIGW